MSRPLKSSRAAAPPTSSPAAAAGKSLIDAMNDGVLDGMQSGEMLMLVSNCPGTPADVDAWVNNTPLELVDRVEIARGAFEFYLRKK